MMKARQKQTLDLLGVALVAGAEIFRAQTQQQIAHRATHDVSLVASILQSLDHAMARSSTSEGRFHARWLERQPACRWGCGSCQLLAEAPARGLRILSIRLLIMRTIEGHASLAHGPPFPAQGWGWWPQGRWRAPVKAGR